VLIDSVTGATPTVCPACMTPLVTLHAETPWCERCEWGLDRPTPQPEDSGMARWRRRTVHRVGWRLDRRLYALLAGGDPQRPRPGADAAVLVTVSAVLALLLIAVLAIGAYLVVAGVFLMKAVGALMVGAAVLMRPRLGRLRPLLAGADELTREQAPQLFGLLDQVATAAGAPMPHHVLLTPEFNAGMAVVGLRRRRVLMLGLPMWAVLRPQERVALLGHEFGHTVNNDVRRGLASRLALTTFGHLADLLLPAHPPSYQRGLIDLATRLARVLLWPVLWSAAQLLWCVHLGLNVLGARDGQRAEYYADALAARVAGSNAVQSLSDALVSSGTLAAVTASRARGRQLAAGWRVAAEQTRQEQQPRLARLRQLSLRRDSSPFASHPPGGLRHRMIAAHPHRTPAVVLTDSRSALIDAELARYEESIRRIIAETA
jgi:heat shock protein HtpX